MIKKKLRIGVLLDNFKDSAWFYAMLQQIQQGDYAEFVLIVKNAHASEHKVKKTLFKKLKDNYGQIFSTIINKVLIRLYFVLIERNTYRRNAFETKNIKDLLPDIPILEVLSIKKKWSDYFQPDDITDINSYNVDIFIRGGFGILRGDILTSAKHGIWSFHHGDNTINRGGPAGYWESMESWPTTGAILQILTEDLDNGKILSRSFSCTNALSVTDNKNNYFWSSLSFMGRKMKELHSTGEKVFFEKVTYNNRHPSFYSERLYTLPNNYELAKLTLKKIKNKVTRLFENKFYLNQWILMFHLKEEFSSSLWRYKKIIPPINKFWADPHIIYRDHKYYIYLEEYLYDTNKGHISLIIMDENGNYKEPEIILNKPYHLSYPFVFEHENELYMVPESIANNTVELYKCVQFPNKWEFQMNLMEGVNAVDATLLYHQNKWWMFVNMFENEGASTEDELFLFYSDNLYSDNWQPHPMNPIISDCRNARPAGKVFMENGTLYRPSQNCSVRYGYGFNINEIIIIDEQNYSEKSVSKVEPNWDKKILGTHTFNRVNNLHIIDAIRQRRK